MTPMRHMLINPTYNGIMFMLLEEACRIHWDEMQKSPYEIRPAESRIYAKDFEASRGNLPAFDGDPERIHQTWCPPYVDKWNSLFAKVSNILLDLEEGERVFNLSDC